MPESQSFVAVNFLFFHRVHRLSKKEKRNKKERTAAATI
jgi:hypothetical protein